MMSRLKDPDWKHHEGYPRDITDEEAEKRKHGDLGLYVVSMELVVGPIDVAHHVRMTNGVFVGCNSTTSTCIGTVERIDQHRRQVHIRLNDYGKKKMGAG